jgi:hypothetical protein
MMIRLPGLTKAAIPRRVSGLRGPSEGKEKQIKKESIYMFLLVYTRVANTELIEDCGVGVVGLECCWRVGRPWVVL